jgi:hypothetical protein
MNQISWTAGDLFGNDKDLSTIKVRFKKPALKIVTAVKSATAAGDEKEPLITTLHNKHPPDDDDVKVADAENEDEKAVVRQHEHGHP